MTLDISDIYTLLQDKYTPVDLIRKTLKELELSGIEDNSEYLELINQLKTKERNIKHLYRQKAVNFIEINNGSLGIGGRPGLGKIEEFYKESVSSIVTLLKDEEKQVSELGEKIKSFNINWIRLPLSASVLSLDDEFILLVNNIYDDIILRLENKEKIFIHCAAGVHRTGAFTNGLLLKAGFSKSEAKEKIYEMRPVTAIEAISKHWNWSSEIIR